MCRRGEVRSTARTLQSARLQGRGPCCRHQHPPPPPGRPQVKPQGMKPVLEALAPHLQPGRHLVISIAAGIRLATMEAALGPGARVVRVMPNTPCLVQVRARIARCALRCTCPARSAAAVLEGLSLSAGSLLSGAAAVGGRQVAGMVR